MRYFSKPKCLEANVKVELDLSNYTTKTDVNDRSSLPKKKMISLI